MMAHVSILGAASLLEIHSLNRVDVLIFRPSAIQNSNNIGQKQKQAEFNERHYLNGAYGGHRGSRWCNYAANKSRHCKNFD